MVTAAHVAGLARLALAPASLVVVYDTPTARIVGVAVVLVAGISDILDGRLARKYGTVSVFGVFLDLTADKVFVALALVALLAVDRAPLAVVAIILFREFSIMGLRAYAAAVGLVVPSGPWGAAKTIVLFMGIAMSLIVVEVGSLLLWIASAFAVVSGFQYALTIARHVRNDSVGVRVTDGPASPVGPDDVSA